jgi:hypothetical protein
MRDAPFVFFQFRDIVEQNPGLAGWHFINITSRNEKSDVSWMGKPVTGWSRIDFIQGHNLLLNGLGRPGLQPMFTIYP